MERAPGIDLSGGMDFKRRREIIGEAFMTMPRGSNDALDDTGELELGFVISARDALKRRIASKAPDAKELEIKQFHDQGMEVDVDTRGTLIDKEEQNG